MGQHPAHDLDVDDPGDVGEAVPARGEVRLRHGGGHHLMLIGLKAPLEDGDRFPMTLRFEKAGEREVMVWVQQPRDAAGAHEPKH